MKLTKELKNARGTTETLVFINNLRKLIYITDTTTDEIANKSGVQRQAIYEYIRCKKIPTINTMLKICKFFNVSMEDMLTKKIEITYKFVDLEIKGDDE